MEVSLKQKHIDYLRRTYPTMTTEQAYNAFLNDSLNDTKLMDRAAERIGERRDLIGSLVLLCIVIVWSYFYFR